MNVNCKPVKELNGSYLIETRDDNGNHVYERYVEITRWQAEADVVTAEITTFINARVAKPPEVATPIINAATVSMTEDQADKKLADVVAAKQAAFEAAQLAKETPQ